MRIIVPMAGMGKRMRPHTLTIPKPLIPVAGKPIVQHLVEDLAKMCNEPIEEIAFIVGRFGAEVENQLVQIAENLGSQGTIHYQDEPLGTAHAILCAHSALKGKVIVAFADTIFKADFKVEGDLEGVIWVQKVEDPSAFGVVKLSPEGHITDFVEKPDTFVSDLAIIGVYYFQDGEYLRKELQYLLDNNIRDKGEYQLTNALENMKNKGTRFVPGKVKEWLDCGNKDATVYTNKRVLEYLQQDGALTNNPEFSENSIVIPPCFFGKGVRLKNSIVGPHVSMGHGTVIENSVVSNSIIQEKTVLGHKLIENSMIGNFVKLTGKPEDLSIGDYTTQS